MKKYIIVLKMQNYLTREKKYFDVEHFDHKPSDEVVIKCVNNYAKSETAKRYHDSVKYGFVREVYFPNRD